MNAEGIEAGDIGSRPGRGEREGCERCGGPAERNAREAVRRRLTDKADYVCIVCVSPRRSPVFITFISEYFLTFTEYYFDILISYRLYAGALVHVSHLSATSCFTWTKKFI